MSDEPFAEKNALRARFRRERTRMKPAEQLVRDADIVSRLLTLPEYRRCTVLLTYVALPDEVSTDALIQAAWANGKIVAVPRCNPDSTMTFYRIDRWDQLSPGTFGVREPKAECVQVEATPDSVCVVPGLCFDVSGNRLGYGKGFYDRFLQTFPGKRIGLCPASAVVLRLPVETRDQPVQIIVTEQYVRRTTGQGKEDPN